MKLVIIGGSGLIGTKLVTKLREHGHEAVPASPNSGVNALTGEGLAEVLQGAAVVVDVSNSPSFEEKAVMEFFTTSTRNLLIHEESPILHHQELALDRREVLTKGRCDLVVLQVGGGAGRLVCVDEPQDSVAQRRRFRRSSTLSCRPGSRSECCRIASWH